MVVRPPEGNREWITRLLDAGVRAGYALIVEEIRRALPAR